MGYESGTTGVCAGVVKKPVPNNPLPAFDFPRQRPIFAADTRNIKEEQIMNATVSLEGILQMLRPLSADSKRWLADKLIEESKKDAPCQYTVEEMQQQLLQVKARILQGDPGLSNEEVEEELLEEEHLTPYTMEEINTWIDQAEADFAAGRGIPAEEANREIREALPWLK